MPVREGKFRTNCCSEHHTLRKGSRNSCPYSPNFLSDFERLRHKCSHNCIK